MTVEKTFKVKVDDRLLAFQQAAAFRRGAQEISSADNAKLKKFKAGYSAAVGALVPEKSGEEKKSNA